LKRRRKKRSKLFNQAVKKKSRWTRNKGKVQGEGKTERGELIHLGRLRVEGRIASYCTCGAPRKRGGEQEKSAFRTTGGKGAGEEILSGPSPSRKMEKRLFIAKHKETRLFWGIEMWGWDHAGCRTIGGK